MYVSSCIVSIRALSSSTQHKTEMHSYNMYMYICTTNNFVFKSHSLCVSAAIEAISVAAVHMNNRIKDLVSAPITQLQLHIPQLHVFYMYIHVLNSCGICSCSCVHVHV